jgi:ribonuclease R
MPHDVYVPQPRDVGQSAHVGDKVVVELKEWESRHTNPEGEIIEVLGPPSEEGVDMLSVLRQYDLALRFPKAVLHEARAMGTVIRPADLQGCEDCRSHPVITIDPDDAKDFDDAICLERGSAGQWKLWVHIADVSRYVKPGTALDVEARRRGNSTYLVDRVIPMLPEALSNELCSLRPRVDRLTRCVEFLLSGAGSLIARSWTFCRLGPLMTSRACCTLRTDLPNASAAAGSARARSISIFRKPKSASTTAGASRGSRKSRTTSRTS